MRTPWLTLALLLTLALGIGSNVSILGFARGLIRPDSPLAVSERVVSIFERDVQGVAGPLSYQDYLRLKTAANTFDWIGAARMSPASIDITGESEILSVAAVTSNLARALKLSLNNGVLLSHRVWQNEFSSNGSLEGEQISIDRMQSKVTGIAPLALEGLYRDHPVDIWMQLGEKNAQAADDQSRSFWVVASLRHDVSIVAAEMRFGHQISDSNQLLILPYTGITPEIGGNLSRIGMLFNFAAGAVFFIACANVIAFLLGRAFARSQETSIRVALGAKRMQLARELLSDSVVISVAGGALGFLLALWTTRLVPNLLFDQDAQRLVFAPGLFSVLTTCSVCVGITIVCGIIPALTVSDDKPANVLRSESAGASKAMVRMRIALVVGQMTSCCILVISTAFLLNGFRAAMQTRLSRRLGDPILLTVQASPERGIHYFQDVEMTTRSILMPIAWAGKLPGSEPIWRFFHIDPLQQHWRDVTLDLAWFDPESLKLFILPPKAGQLFGFVNRACKVAVVNESGATELYDRNTVGRAIRDSAGQSIEIIGVLTAKATDSALARQPTIFYNGTDQPQSSRHLMARAQFRASVLSKLPSVELDANVVSSSYFRAMGFSLISGREFDDSRAPGECRIAVINQEAADVYFGEKAIGAAVIDEQGIRTEIIGVIHSMPLGAFQPRVEPSIYFPMSQDLLPRMTLLAGDRHVNDAALADLRNRLAAIPGRGPAPVMITALSTYLSHTALAPVRIATIIVGASAVTALLLCILGLFGALNDAARQRSRELAIRVAFGALRWRVIYQVVKEGGQLALAGTLLGTFGSLVLSRFLLPIVPGHSSPTFLVWLAAPVLLAMAVTVAGILPARRALLINPIRSMREEH